MNGSVFMQSRSPTVAGVLVGAFATVALLLFPGTVHAAQQSLGLVATAQPIPMICDDDGCVAQLSSFCLQQERKTPIHHAPYHVAGGDGVWLHLTDAGGGQRTVPADGFVQLASTRGFTAIEVRISTVDMAALGAVEVSVQVGDLVTLFPEAIADDPNPITAADGAHAIGPARQLAASFFDVPDGLGDTINILDRAINSMTRSSRLTDQGRLDFWAKVAGVPLDSAVDRRTSGAAKIFTGCLDDIQRKTAFSLRKCLESKRYELLINTNFQLWNAQAAGS